MHGIDASPEVIEVATRKAAQDGSTVDFGVGLIEALPFPDGSFSLATSSLMLHHLPDELKAKGLQEIGRVLKPGGCFVAMDFAVESHSRLGHLVMHLPSMFGRSRGESVVEKLTPMLKDAGFREVEVVPTRYKRSAYIRAR